MLLILPIILSRIFPIIFTHYSLFIPMLSPIIFNLIVSLVKLHMAADK